ncbi:MAG: RNA methyltransferase, partial [Chloroflexi bacterium]
MITSSANARIKAIRALRQRKERERTGLFFVEGIRLV